MSSSILLPYQPLNRWNEKAIQPGPQGSMGDALTQIRIQQSLPSMPVKFNSTFSGANSAKRGSNVQDGQTRSYSDGGRGAEVVVRKRQKFTNVGWREQNLSGNDRTFQSVMAPQPRVGFRTQVDSILHRQGDAFQVMPGGYGPEPGQLLRGGQVPRVVSGYLDRDPSARGVNSASETPVPVQRGPTVVENTFIPPLPKRTVVEPPGATITELPDTPASEQAGPSRQPKQNLLKSAANVLVGGAKMVPNAMMAGAKIGSDVATALKPLFINGKSKKSKIEAPQMLQIPRQTPSTLYIEDRLSPVESVSGPSRTVVGKKDSPETRLPISPAATVVGEDVPSSYKNDKEKEPLYPTIVENKKKVQKQKKINFATIKRDKEKMKQMELENLKDVQRKTERYNAGVRNIGANYIG